MDKYLVSGDTYTWGNGSNGKLGLGDEDDRLTPTKIEAEFKAKQVSCGDFHTAVLTCMQIHLYLIII